MCKLILWNDISMLDSRKLLVWCHVIQLVLYIPEVLKKWKIMHFLLIHIFIFDCTKKWKIMHSWSIWDYHIFRRTIALVAVLFLCFVSDHRWSINWGKQSWFSPIIFCNCRLSYLTWQQREEVAKKHEGEYMSTFFLTEVIRWSYHVSFLICYHSLV